MLADEFDGVPIGFPVIFRATGLWHRYVPFILTLFLWISDATFYFFVMLLLIVSLIENGEFRLSSCIKNGIPTISSV